MKILAFAAIALPLVTGAGAPCGRFDEDGDWVHAIDCTNSINGWDGCREKAKAICTDGYTVKKAIETRGRWSGWPNVRGEQRTLIVKCD